MKELVFKFKKDADFEELKEEILKDFEETKDSEKAFSVKKTTNDKVVIVINNASLM